MYELREIQQFDYKLHTQTISQAQKEMKAKPQGKRAKHGKTLQTCHALIAKSIKHLHHSASAKVLDDMRMVGPLHIPKLLLHHLLGLCVRDLKVLAELQSVHS